MDYVKSNSSRTVSILLGMFPEIDRENIIYELQTPKRVQPFDNGIEYVHAIQPSEMTGNVIIYGSVRKTGKIEKVQINENYCPLKLNDAYNIQETILDNYEYRSYTLGEDKVPGKYIRK